MENQHGSYKESEKYKIFEQIIQLTNNYSLVTDFSNESVIRNSFQNNIEDETVQLIVSYELLNMYVFNFCMVAYWFNNHTLNLISWYKSELNKCPLSIKEIVKKYTIRVLEDKERYPFDATMLIDGIRRTNSENKLQSIPQSILFYFTGKEEFEDLELLNEGIFRILGTFKTKNQIIMDFVEEHYSKEFLDIVANKLPQSLNNHTLEIRGVLTNSKIDWKKDERLIPYLIHLLNEAGFIDERNQFAFISKFFTVNGKVISRKSLKSNYSQADYLNRNHKKIPIELKQINEIINKLNEVLSLME